MDRELARWHPPMHSDEPSGHMASSVVNQCKVIIAGGKNTRFLVQWGLRYKHSLGSTSAQLIQWHNWEPYHITICVLSFYVYVYAFWVSIYIEIMPICLWISYLSKCKCIWKSKDYVLSCFSKGLQFQRTILLIVFDFQGIHWIYLFCNLYDFIKMFQSFDFYLAKLWCFP